MFEISGPHFPFVFEVLISRYSRMTIELRIVANMQPLSNGESGLSNFSDLGGVRAERRVSEELENSFMTQAVVMRGDPTFNVGRNLALWIIIGILLVELFKAIIPHIVLASTL